MFSFISKFKVYFIIGAIALSWGYWTKSLIEENALKSAQLKGWRISLKVWQKEINIYIELNKLAHKQRLEREKKLKKVEDNLKKMEKRNAKAYNNQLHPATIKFMLKNFSTQRNKIKGSARVRKNRYKPRRASRYKNRRRSVSVYKRSKKRNRKSKRPYYYLL